ncbi:MAG: hypothetical protein Q8N63_05455 [Nanoarchaeota archaeon]|nr:hypothetical protein [Nanoarchaeota archaeon]
MDEATLENKAKVLSTPEELKEAGLTEEHLKKIGEKLQKFDKLCRYMDKHFYNIFEVVPERLKYAVGSWEMVNGKERPVIHYFENKYFQNGFFEPLIRIFRASNPRGAIDFMKECVSKDKDSRLMYRHDDETILMF